MRLHLLVATRVSAVGPFYCPADQKVYIDLAFYDELKRKFAAPGDFAQAYVIAHEVGHHVQNLLGFSSKVHQARQQASSEEEANRLSVRLELPADYLLEFGRTMASRSSISLSKATSKRGSVQLGEWGTT